MDVPQTLSEGFGGVLEAASGNSWDLAVDANFHELACKFLPSFTARQGNPGGTTSASALFGAASLQTASLSLSVCHPELPTLAATNFDRSYRVAFNGELKSVAKTWIDQGVYYVIMDIIRVFRAPADDTGEQKRIFFKEPPVGFVLTTFPHVAYIFGVEWIGKFLVSPVCQPFLLGSREHERAVAGLPDIVYSAPVSLPSGSGVQWFRYPGDEKISWTIFEGIFYKVLRADARSGSAFASMAQV